ncbi:MAG TPA: VPLPA-CTERM-specific exosortase XrtD [Nitrospira sp.]|nr:VPLPA-CTERM-specific exosortase XrtD [Nitrospira sp.]
MTTRPTTLGTSPASSELPLSSSVLNGGHPLFWVLLAAVATILGYLYADSLRFLVDAWLEDNNSHGPFIPLISLYMIWMRRHGLQSVDTSGTWWGVPIVGIGLFVYVVGQFAAMHAIVHVSLWLVIVGLLTCAIGLSGIRQIAFPLCYLLAAIPPPTFLQYELSSRLQLWSSALGIGFLQSIGIMALRDGNVIDLGRIQLQVVEACSGLRYLFPLTTLTILGAYLYRDTLWKRILLVLSSIPISILLNGVRIGVIGVLVEHYGSGAAEGFTHFFEGWVIFVASLGLLCLEMWLLGKVGSGLPSRPFWELIGLPEPRPVSGPSVKRHTPVASFAVGVALLVLTVPVAPLLVQDEFPQPVRQSLLEFPLRLDAWEGVSAPIERQYLDALQLDDYLLADYTATGQPTVNVYVAYYLSPKKGRSSHSPKQCIPGGGWEITSFAPVEMDRVAGGAPGREINRVVIQKGGQKQIVYYWFKQRDRWITSEYLVKFFLFWDSLTRHRADGALIRLTSSVHAGESEAVADQRLQTLAGLVTPLLDRYVPD